MLARRGFRARPWAVEWDEAAIDFLIERGFSAELGPGRSGAPSNSSRRRPSRRDGRERAPRGDQFLFITADRRGRLRVGFVDPDADDPAAAPEAADTGDLSLARVALGRRDASEAAFLTGEETASQQPSNGRCAQGGSPRGTREPAFWQSHDRFVTVARRVPRPPRGGCGHGGTAHASGCAAGTRGDTRPAGLLVRLVAGRLHVPRRAPWRVASGSFWDAAITVEV